jgi:aspartyl-tRNA(Asn)/glutamyl-tRNA(Gln) amidotransferase subunit A
MTDSDPDCRSAVDVARAIRAGRLGAAEVMAATLERVRVLDPAVGAYATVCDDAALAEAAACDRERSAGRLRGPLHGVPVAVKDVVDVAGVSTGCGSRVREGHAATADAPVVQRLRAAGAIVVGKSHTHEFAYGPICPATRNAWDPERIAGGSSGGSAVAVALGMAAAAVGTDTGGSIRIPAAYNGLVGLKATYGRVPKSGVAALAWSLDHVGPITRTVADAALMLRVMAGRDRSDPTSARERVDDYGSRLDAGVRGMRLGVPVNYFLDVEAEVLAAFHASVAELVALGAERVEVRIPDVELSPVAYAGIRLPEASAFHQAELRSVADRYGDHVRHLLELGEVSLATHYLNAQRARSRIKEGARRTFEEHGLDALLVPAVACTAPRAGEDTITVDGGGRRPMVPAVIGDCAPFNLTGQPILTVPCGFSAEGLPIGLGIAGRPFGEAAVLRIGAAYEAATRWNRRSAPPWPAAHPSGPYRP